MRAAFRRRFVTGEGRLVSETQTAYVLVLYFGLLDRDETDQAVAALVRDIEARGDHLSTGFVGTPYLLHVLTNHGRLDLAYQLLLQTSSPSWLYPITQGATTIWERWDGWTEARGFQDPAMNSFNHYAYGAVGEWMYGTLAGLELDPGPGADAQRVSSRAHSAAPAAHRRLSERRADSLCERDARFGARALRSELGNQQRSFHAATCAFRRTVPRR